MVSTKVNFSMFQSLNPAILSDLDCNTLYSQKDHPFSLPLSAGFNVSNCHLIKILLRDTGVLIVHKRLAESLDHIEPENAFPISGPTVE